MDINIHDHACERMVERGVTIGDVIATISQGATFPAKYGRTGFRRNFPFNNEWRGTYYKTKQVEAYAVQEDGDWLVITVIARYF